MNTRSSWNLLVCRACTLQDFRKTVLTDDSGSIAGGGTDFRDVVFWQARSNCRTQLAKMSFLSKNMNIYLSQLSECLYTVVSFEFYKKYINVTGTTVKEGAHKT